MNFNKLAMMIVLAATDLVSLCYGKTLPTEASTSNALTPSALTEVKPAKRSKDAPAKSEIKKVLAGRSPRGLQKGVQKQLEVFFAEKKARKAALSSATDVAGTFDNSTPSEPAQTSLAEAAATEPDAAHGIAPAPAPGAAATVTAAPAAALDALAGVQMPTTLKTVSQKPALQGRAVRTYDECIQRDLAKEDQKKTLCSELKRASASLPTDMAPTEWAKHPALSNAIKEALPVWLDTIWLRQVHRDTQRCLSLDLEHVHRSFICERLSEVEVVQSLMPLLDKVSLRKPALQGQAVRTYDACIQRDLAKKDQAEALCSELKGASDSFPTEMTPQLSNAIHEALPDWVQFHWLQGMHHWTGECLSLLKEDRSHRSLICKWLAEVEAVQSVVDEQKAPEGEGQDGKNGAIANTGAFGAIAVMLVMAGAN